MIWIIGGTGEGEAFSKILGDIPHIVTLGTREGLNYFKGQAYKYKRMDSQEMINFIKDEGVKLTIDLSHPFAVNVSANAKEACKACGIDYYRYERQIINSGINTHEFSNYEECFEYLKTFKGTLLITTGSNRVEDFEKVRRDNRFIYRILPMVDSVTKLNNLNIHMRDIIAMVGPFSKNYEIELYKYLRLDGVVMKDSGKAGGTDQKISACDELGLKSFVISRTGEDSESFRDFSDKMFKIIQKSQDLL